MMRPYHPSMKRVWGNRKQRKWYTCGRRHYWPRDRRRRREEKLIERKAARAEERLLIAAEFRAIGEDDPR